ncbi:hypothetical protein ACRAKI_09410 [Saccharothrix isguenensis]
MSRLLEALAKYRAAGELQVQRLVAHDPPVRRVCTAVSAFVARVDDRGRPPVWAEARNAAAAMRWLLLTRPLAAHGGPEGIDAALRVLRTQARHLAERVDPALLAELHLVIEAAEELHNADDRLGDLVSAAAQNASGSVCIVSVGVSARQEAQRVLGERLPGVAFLGPRQFLNGPVWDLAVVVGLSSWFADELFTAPRCVKLALVHHGWLRDRNEVSGLLAAAGGTRMQLLLPPGQGVTDPTSESIRSPADIVDWSGVEPIEGKPQDGDPSDDVPARLVVLAGGYGFYLDADADTIRGIDPAGSAGRWVRQIPATDLDAGSVVMLRKGISERETLLPRIGAILGDREAAVRKQQDLWKSALRRHLAVGGLRDLRRALGMPQLSLGYAKYWAGKNCISPRQAVFEKLLAHLGMADAQACCSAAKLLYSAHHKAGQQLVKELGDSVDDAVVRRLETEDSVTLAVGTGTSSLQITLFKVVAVSPETTTVPAAALRTALKLRGAEWLA